VQHNEDGSDEVRAHDTWDGGVTWAAGRTISASASDGARRTMPRACVMPGNVAFAGWYERRATTAEQADRVDYVLGLIDDGTLREGVQGPRLPVSAAGSAPATGESNGLACAAGRTYAAWASSGAPAQAGILVRALEPPTLSVEIVNNQSVPAQLHAKIDNLLRTSNVSGGVVIGNAVLSEGKHVVALGSGAFRPTRTVFGGDCDASGVVRLSMGEHKRCLITNTFPPGAGCEAGCRIEKTECAGAAQASRTDAKRCAQQYDRCARACRR
jgi:hypothetical protein